ncbi:MAG: hypothetical protein AB8E15_06020 [Bdellovibrionales bacterium]
MGFRAATIVLFVLVFQKSQGQFTTESLTRDWKAYTYSYDDASLKQRYLEAKKDEELKEFYEALDLEFEESELEVANFESLILLTEKLVSEKNYWPALAIYSYIIEKAKGTKYFERATIEISNLITKYNLFVPSKMLESWFLGQSIEGMHPEAQSFISYIQMKFFIKKGFLDWAGQSKKRINENSIWHNIYKFDKLIDGLKLATGVGAYNSIKNFLDTSLIPERNQEKLRLFAARFLFEIGEMQKAFEVYKELKVFDEKLSSTVLLEMAWSKYYAKDFSHSLGLLHLLKAPYYVSSADPEQFVLEALIYKDLCYYDEIKRVETQFLNYFEDSFFALNARLRLAEEVKLIQLVFRSEDLLPTVQMIRNINKISKNKFLKNSSLNKVIKQKLDEILKEQKEYIEFETRDRSMAEADNLLKIRQEINFLKYSSEIERNQLNVNKEGYESEKPKKYKFDKLFWKSGGEFWLQEFEDYRVLVNSKCNKEESEVSADE